MTIARIFATTLLVLGITGGPASAQVSITPDAPRWGEKITISADPAVLANDAQRFYKGDRVYGVLSLFHAGRKLREPLDVPLTWNGRAFVGQAIIVAGCETGIVGLSTIERRLGGRVNFVCRKADGSLPPGARIAGLASGAWNKSNWKADIAQDLAAMRNVEGHGWEYEPAWRFSWRENNTPMDERVRDVERVDREEGRTANPELLGSLAWGYYRAGQPRKVFDKFKELCDRFPESPAVLSGLAAGNAARIENPEFEAEFNTRVAQLAKSAPGNPVLHNFFEGLATKTPGVDFQTVQTIAESWIADEPNSVKARWVLATVLAKMPDCAAEAEQEINKAIELSFQPHSFLSSDTVLYQQRAFQLRSELRRRHGDLVGAIADARMAQAVAQDKAGADDIGTEADLWWQLGFTRKSESLAVQAYALGSLKGESVLKNSYVASRGSESGFQDFLIEQLRATDHPLELLSKAVPAFSATTLDGAKLDPATLRGRMTVVDFWFTGCPPCRAERPKLNALVDELGGRVRFIGFASDKPEALKSYLSQTPFKYEIVPNSGPIAAAFGVTGWPYHLIIGPAGNIVWLDPPSLAESGPERVERLRRTIFRVLARSGEERQSKEN